MYTCYVHSCVSTIDPHRSENGLSPVRRQAIVWSNAVLLWIVLWGTNFIGIWIQQFSFKKINLKYHLLNGNHFVPAALCKILLEAVSNVFCWVRRFLITTYMYIFSYSIHVGFHNRSVISGFVPLAASVWNTQVIWTFPVIGKLLRWIYWTAIAVMDTFSLLYLVCYYDYL